MPAIEALPAQMNPTDALFWAMELLPQFRSMIGGLIVLDGAPDPEAVRAEFERVGASYYRLRQRVVDPAFGLGAPEWAFDPKFDLDYHVRTIATPAPATLDDLLTELGPIYATPLDRARPLWEAYFTGPLAGGRSAVFVKMHHCLVDGVGGTRLLTELFGEPGTDRIRDAAAPLPSAVAPGGLVRAAGDAIGAAAAWAAFLGDVARHPWANADALASGLRGMVGIARELTTTRAESPLHAARSLSRCLARFDMSLPDIDAVRTRVGATNNDVLLTVVSGALHRWHTSRGADVQSLRALVPVNLRTDADDVAGNRLALLAVALPVGEPSPLRRLRIVQRHMGQVKRDQRARLYPALARLVAMLPTWTAARIVGQQMNRANVVCTNVPGPERTCWLAGRPIAAIYAFAPMVGDHPVAIAAYRYRDAIHVGLDVDPLAMPDLPRFLDALGESYAETMTLRDAETDGALAPPADDRARSTG